MRYVLLRSVFALTLLALAVPTVAQDGFEPNDSFSQSAAIPLDTDYDATIHTNGDVDFYTVVVEEPGVLFVRLLSVPGTISLRVRVFNDQQQELVDFTGDRGTIFQTPANVAPGSYYVQVSRWGGSASEEPYQFRVELDRNDPFEPNQSFSAAATVPLDTDLTGMLAPNNDLDYVTVTTPGPGVLIARLTEVPGAYSLRTAIYDEQQQEQMDLAGGTGTIFSTPIQTAGQLHYVRFSRYGGTWARDPYRYRIEYDPTDQYETNGAFNQAKSIPGDETITAQIIPNDDLDYYAFSVVEAGPVTVRVESVPGDLSLRVYLYDGEQRQVDNWSTSSAASATYTLDPGRYYVRMSRWGGDGSYEPYQFRVEGAVVATATEASVLPFGASLSAPAPHPFRDATTLTLLTAQPGRVVASVYDLLGRRVQVVHDGPVPPGTPFPLRVEAAHLTPGLYLVRVEGPSFSYTRRILRTR